MSVYDSTLAALTQQANAYAAAFNLNPAGAHNGAWDAFRHAYASAGMTRIYGALTAESLGNMNETWGDISHNQPADEKNMDLWNNAQGRSIGKSSTGPDDSALEAILKIDDGTLIVSPSDPRKYVPPQNPTPPTDEMGNPIGTSGGSDGGDDAGGSDDDGGPGPGFIGGGVGDIPLIPPHQHIVNGIHVSPETNASWVATKTSQSGAAIASAEYLTTALISAMANFSPRPAGHSDVLHAAMMTDTIRMATPLP